MSEASVIPTFTIHDRLRKAREFAHLEQGELAHAIGISRGTVGNYESGATTRLKPIVLKQWALGCGVPLDWIEYGDHAPDGGPDGGRGQGVRSYGWKTREHLLTAYAA